MPKSFFRKFTKRVFVLVNVILAIFFLLSCYAKWFNPVQWWFIGLLTLVSFYLFALLFIFFIFWLFVRPRWSLIFILTLLIAWKPIGNIIPLRFRPHFTKEKQSSALRVMSWNVAQFEILEYKTHPEKKEAMLQLINQYQPDIACFQEMVCGDSSDPVIYHLKGIADTLNFPYNFYAYNYKENFFRYTHFGIIIFSKYPIIHKKTLSFHPHDYNSIFQYIDVAKGPDTIRIFNIHLQSLKFSEANLRYLDSPTLRSEQDIEKSKNVISKFKTGFLKRQLQSNRIKAEINKSPYPVLVCGDFNDVPNSYAYETIGNGLQDAFVEKGTGIGRTFSGISPTLRIDNIFADKKFSVEQFTRVTKKLSDHFPIVADINVSYDQAY